MGERDFLEQYILKKVKVVFDDGNHITYKTGVLTGYDQSFVYIDIANSKEAIALSKVVRIEFLEGD